MAENATSPSPSQRAGKAGLGIAAPGVAVLNVAPFTDRVDPTGDGDPRTGYATDSLIPFTAHLAVGLLLAMLCAASRTRRGQNRVSVAIAGSAPWALGSGLLAREVEGDDEHVGAVRAAR